MVGFVFGRLGVEGGEEGLCELYLTHIGLGLLFERLSMEAVEECERCRSGGQLDARFFSCYYQDPGMFLGSRTSATDSGWLGSTDHFAVFKTLLLSKSEPASSNVTSIVICSLSRSLQL